MYLWFLSTLMNCYLLESILRKGRRMKDLCFEVGIGIGIMLFRFTRVECERGAEREMGSFDNPSYWQGNGKARRECKGLMG